MDRRSFLCGAITLSAIAVASPSLALSGTPVIYGDGINDDWAGLQAMFDGKAFRIDSEVVVAGDGVVSGGNFVLSRTLTLRGDFVIVDCKFTAKDWVGNKCLLRSASGSNGAIKRIGFDMSGWANSAIMYEWAA